MNNYDYIINAFTQDGTNVNEEIDNLTVGCITSKNNNFELDSQGNLTVKTVTETNPSGGGSINILDMYPIGSVYISTNATFDPNTSFGGTWQKIQDRFLVGAGNSYNVGATGGSNNHTHTLNSSGYAKLTGWSADGALTYYEVSNVPNWTSNFGIRGSVGVGSKTSSYGAGLGGQTASANNIPLYRAVNMWERIA